MFTKQQIEFIAKYYAASNTGLVGLHFPKPTTLQGIDSVFNQISYEYEVNTGEGLHEEYIMWKQEISEPSDYEFNLKRVKKDIPFVMK
jgi:hypothetical protein